MKRRHHASRVAAFIFVEGTIEHRACPAEPASHRSTRIALPACNGCRIRRSERIGHGPDGVTAGPGNSVWFTEYAADKIGTIDPVTHAISEFPTPTPDAEPFRITLGPDGNLWFTEFGAGKIGMINPTTDKFTEYALSNPNAAAVRNHRRSR